MNECKTCRWSCGSMSKDNKKPVMLCLHPKTGSRSVETDKACRDHQREPGTEAE